jgi:DNA-binding winged helix-turn-helix (wHTH) protein/TolB-like protein/tetratricopeptide (TPR) repeat protein
VSSKISLGLPESILKMGNSNTRYVYEFGDFRLDAGHLMLYHGDEELSLAPKAVETLVALVERRGEITSKDELLEAVWPDAIVEESNLFVYLSVLRKTLGTKDNGDPWVETLRRRGYRFSGDVRLIPAQNGGNGIPHIKPAALRLLHSTSDVPSMMSENAPSEPRPRKPANLRTVYALSGVTLVMAAVAFAYQYFFNHSIHSIAVMPFVNETRDAELDYLPDAVTGSFIDSLSKVQDLKVQPRSSVFRYKGKETNPREIGTELGADAVLYGRVTKTGENIELHVELFDAQSGARVWEATDTKKIEDLVLLGRRNQRELVTKLGRGPSGPTEQEVSGHPNNTDAYRLYHQGLGYTLKLTRPEIRTGIDYLYKAVAKDPAYAKAYASIARAHLILGIACEVDPSEFVKARDAAQKAIELDGTLAEGYSALAGVAFFYDRKFTEAESLYIRALELDPKSSTAHQQYADFLNKTGRHEEGAAEIRLAMELEPSSVFINAFYAISIRDNEVALDQIRFAIDQGPDNYVVHLFAGEIYRRNEMYDEAVAELRRAKELSPEQTWSDVFLIGALVDLRRIDEARIIADEMLRDSKTRYIPPPHLALAYKQLGDKDKASIYFEEGYNVRDPKMVFLNEPRWNDRNDPRFQELLRRVGFAL